MLPVPLAARPSNDLTSGRTTGRTTGLTTGLTTGAVGARPRRSGRFRSLRRPAILLAAVATVASLAVAFGPSAQDFNGAPARPAPAAPAAPAEPAVPAVPAASYGHQTSVDGGNWAGVLIPSGSFSSVRSSWTEPSVACHDRSEVMAPWVGIDGQNNQAVEQTGVETSCESGQARYRAWYEVYPAPAVYYRNTVRAGDKMTASVTRHGSRYTMTLTNRTRGWSRSTTRTHHTDHSSAEIVVESPSNSYPGYRSVRFGTTTVNGHPVTHYSLLRMHTSGKHGVRNYTSRVAGSTHFSVSHSRS